MMEFSGLGPTLKTGLPISPVKLPVFYIPCPIILYTWSVSGRFLIEEIGQVGNDSKSSKSGHKISPI